MRKTQVALVALCLSMQLASCGSSPRGLPTPELVMDPSGAATAAIPTPTGVRLSPGASEDEVTPLIERVIHEVAIIKRVNVSSIEVLSVEPVEWPEASLGCPEPGIEYDQVVTPGYRITIELGDDTYTLHVGQDGRFVLCEQGQPERLPIPTIDADNLKDGSPWMPVDPISPDTLPPDSK